MKKVIILIGNYGSGKTEIALNMAVMAAAEGKRVQVIDLDRINDYFRMSDHVKLLEESNINLVSPICRGRHHADQYACGRWLGFCPGLGSGHL